MYSGVSGFAIIIRFIHVKSRLSMIMNVVLNRTVVVEMTPGFKPFAIHTCIIHNIALDLKHSITVKQSQV